MLVTRVANWKGRFATWESMGRGRGFGPKTRRMLKDTFGAGIMDKLTACHESFPHQDLTPRA